MAEARIDIRADLSDVTEKFAQLRQQIDGLAGKTAESSAKLAEATAPLSERLLALGGGATALVSGAAAASGALVTVMTKNSGKYAEQVTQIAAQTGLTTDLVQILNVAFNRVGLGLGDILPAFRKFSAEAENLQAGKKHAVATFEAIGLSADDLRGKKPDEIFQLVAQKLGSMEEGFARTHASAELFGRSGLRFIPLFADVAGGFTQVAADAQRMGAVFDAVRLEQLNTMDDKFDDLDSSTKALSRTFGANFAGPVGQAADIIMGLLNQVTAAVSALPQPVVTALGVFMIGGAAIAPALVGLAALVRAVEILMPVITGLYALILAHPFVAIGTAVVVAATLIIANWDKIKAGVQSAAAAIRETVSGMVTDISQWLGARLTAAMGLALAPIHNTYEAFKWLRDKVTGHSEIPDMVREIGDHMSQLDVRMGAPARIATANTLRTFRDFRLTADQIFGQIASVAVSTWGNVTNAISGALAKNITQGNNWAQTWKSIQEMVLTGFLNLGLQMLTQWGITLAKKMLFDEAEGTAHTAMETAKTAATTVGETTRLGIMAATNKVMLAGVISTLAGIAAVGNAALTTMSVIVATTAAIFEAIAAALAASIVGAPMAPAYAAAGALVAGVGGAAVGTGIAALQVAIGSAVVAATSALAVPAFATGGAVFGPTLALVGENASFSNPEYIGHADQLGLNKGGGQQTINVYLDSDVILRAVVRGLPSHLALRGVRA